MLEIFEAYESDDNSSNQRSATTNPAPSVNSAAASAKRTTKSSLQYVEFEFPKPKSFANAKSPADLRRAMDVQVQDA